MLMKGGVLNGFTELSSRYMSCTLLGYSGGGQYN